jgi:hypothetical protein
VSEHREYAMDSFVVDARNACPIVAFGFDE